MKYRHKIYLLATHLTMAVILAHSAFAQTNASRHSANALWQQFQTNPQQAQQALTGRSVTITGVVAGTTTSIYGTPNVLISDGTNRSVNIICVMPRTQFGQLSSFVSGQPVSMTGRFYSGNSAEIYFKSCKRERA